MYTSIPRAVEFFGDATSTHLFASERQHTCQPVDRGIVVADLQVDQDAEGRSARRC
jgi:hypothetical protein